MGSRPAPATTSIDLPSSAGDRASSVERPSAAVEAYITATFELESASHALISGGALASRLGVSEPSVASMLTRLTLLGLVRRESRRGVRLTASGRRVALCALRRQRVLENFLVESVGVPWDEARVEAERLRHAVSDGLTERMWHSLGEPDRDPHGDPIPTAGEEGTVVLADRPLLELAPGEVGLINRVSDADPAMLRYLTARGISLGTRLEVVRREPFNGGVVVRSAGRIETFGPELMQAIRIRVGTTAGR
jgi:DtxR family transcriptional regulator, Mn-dependent transcriptional regulator